MAYIDHEISMQWHIYVYIYTYVFLKYLCKGRYIYIYTWIYNMYYEKPVQWYICIYIYIHTMKYLCNSVCVCARVVYIMITYDQRPM